MDLQSFKTPAGRLKEEGAREILRRKAAGETYQHIAEELKVSIGTVFNVCKRNTWEWVSP